MKPALPLAAMMLCATGPTAAQLQNFRAATHGVAVDVAVFDGDRAITTLGPGDFEILDNGVRQTIVSVDRNVLPIHLRLVFDTSGSITDADLERHRRAMVLVTSALRPDDTCEILTFSSRIAAATAAQRPPVTISLRRRLPDGTAFFDAVSLAMITSPLPDRRQITIVASDAHDNVSFFDEAALLDAARRTDAVVYAIMPVESTKAVPLRARLEALTLLTGGRVVESPRSDRMGRLIAAAIEEFRQGYVVRYTLSTVPAPGWHRLDVRLRGHARYTVRAREGYVSR